jgi:hypothetical protein
MKRILHWIKGAWDYLFEDVRTEMRRPVAPDDAGEHEDDGEPD